MFPCETHGVHMWEACDFSVRVLTMIWSCMDKTVAAYLMKYKVVTLTYRSNCKHTSHALNRTNTHNQSAVCLSTEIVAKAVIPPVLIISFV